MTAFRKSVCLAPMDGSSPPPFPLSASAASTFPCCSSIATTNFTPPPSLPSCPNGPAAASTHKKQQQQKQQQQPIMPASTSSSSSSHETGDDGQVELAHHQDIDDRPAANKSTSNSLPAAAESIFVEKTGMGSPLEIVGLPFPPTTPPSFWCRRSLPPCRSRLLLPVTLFLLSLLISIGHLPAGTTALPTNVDGFVQQIAVPVGGLFEMEGTQLVDRSKLAGWLKVLSNGRLIGIPQLKDVGTHRVALNGRTVELKVGEDQQNTCGADTATIWLEVVDQRRFSSRGIEEQFNAAQEFLAKLRQGTGEGERRPAEQIRKEDLRLFPLSYLDRYRTVTETMHGEEESAAAAGNMPNDRFVFLLNISCGELSEKGTEIISAAAEIKDHTEAAGLNFRVVQGSLQKFRLVSTSSSTSTPSPTTTTTSPSMAETTAKAQPESSSGISPQLIIIIVILLLVLVVATVLFWLRNKQSRKRQKQTDTSTNGKGTSASGGAGTQLLQNEAENGQNQQQQQQQQSVTKS